MNKKILSFLLVGILFISISSDLFAYTQAQLEAANNLAGRNIINDHSSDPLNYDLDNYVLRQEIAAVARGVAKLDKKAMCKNIFADLTSTVPNSWACVNVEPLVENGIISKNANFRPEDNITKAEALGMLIKAGGFDYSFDSSSSKSWQEQVVEYAVNKKIISTFTDYNSEATRGWVFVVANNTIVVQEAIEELKKQGLYTDEIL